jgi:guanine deaminase
LAAEFGLVIHSHLMETKSERVFLPSTVDYLKSANCLGPHTSFAHGVWLDENDIATLAETGTNIIHLPISNLRLGSGIAPIRTMKSRGLNVALGVDNAGGANDCQNMFEVMKYTALIHKLYGPPTQWLHVEDTFDMCLSSGAKVLGKKIGSLHSGCLADLAILRTDRLFVTAKENLINQLVYADLGQSVETVLVGGRVVVEDKKVKTVDEAELYAEAKEGARKVYRDLPDLNRRLAPFLDLLQQMYRKVDDHPLPFTRLADI